MAEGGRVTVREDIVFGRGGGRDLACDVYVPPEEKRDGPLPGVLLLHGGAWRMGDRKQLSRYGLRIGREGYVCVASEYRLTPESPWPAQIHDVKAALRWMRANAAELGIDPDKIAIEGNSAGAHLALLAAGTDGVEEFEGDGGNAGVSTRVAAAIGVYAPTAFSHPERERGASPLAALSNAASAEVAAAAGPITYARADFPPTLLIHGTDDTTVPPLASVRMYEELVKVDAPVELHMFAGQPHAFDRQPEYARLCATTMVLFLDRYVRDPAPARPAPVPV